jgi:hypothetical protein
MRHDAGVGSIFENCHRAVVNLSFREKETPGDKSSNNLENGSWR